MINYQNIIKVEIVINFVFNGGKIKQFKHQLKCMIRYLDR